MVRELVCVLRTTYEKNMAIGSILVLVLRYIGVELVLYEVVKRDLHDIAAAMIRGIDRR
jgi:hypothetical protein